jgi:hypothetical protein
VRRGHAPLHLAQDQLVVLGLLALDQRDRRGFVGVGQRRAGNRHAGGERRTGRGVRAAALQQDAGGLLRA